MSRVETFTQGVPSWIDLSTTDHPAAKEFYTALFGWQYEDHEMGPGMMYSLAQIDDMSAAVIYTRHSQEEEMGVPPHWNVYVSVDDVDAIAAKVADLGGTLIAGPFDVPEPGRMCVVRDPSGGFVQFWQANDATAPRVREEHGAICWAELLTTDQSAAGEFLSSLLGVDVDTDTMPTPDGSQYHVLMAGEEPAAGVMKMPQNLVEMGVPPHWAVYFRVDNAAEVVEKAKSMGAEVIFGPGEMEMVGTLALMRDPQGAVFGIQKPPAE